MFAKRVRPPSPLQGSRLAELLPPTELRRLDRAATIVTLSQPSRVTRQAERGRQFLVVIDGLLEVERRGSRVADLGAGDVAGEISVLTGVPCTADVTAVAGTTVYAMNRRELTSLLSDCPELSKELWRTALHRIPQPA